MSAHDDREDAGAVAGHGLVITGNALVPLGIVVSVILAVVGGVWAVSSKLNEVTTELTALHEEVSDLRVDMQREADSLNDKMTLATSSRFSLFDAKFQWRTFAALNPTIKVPEPTHYPLPGEAGLPQPDPKP